MFTTLRAVFNESVDAIGGNLGRVAENIPEAMRYKKACQQHQGTNKRTQRFLEKAKQMFQQLDMPSSLHQQDMAVQKSL